MDSAENLAAALVITHKVMALALMQDNDRDEVSELVGAALLEVKRAEDGDEDAARRVQVACDGIDQLLADIARQNAH